MLHHKLGKGDYRSKEGKCVIMGNRRQIEIQDVMLDSFD